MRGYGIRIQIGRTTITPHRWLPARWEISTSLMNPKLYGIGIWITRDMWHGNRFAERPAPDGEDR